MAASYKASIAGQVTVEETLDTATNPAVEAVQPLVHTGYNDAHALNATSTPACTKAAIFNKAMVAGAATIDLTAMTHGGATVDFTGLKVQCWKFKAPTTNAANVTLTPGGSNGYNLGGANWREVLAPGAWVLGYSNDTTPDVSGSAKNIALAGTGTDALEVTLMAG
jgi:hypothetical protein